MKLSKKSSGCLQENPALIINSTWSYWGIHPVLSGQVRCGKNYYANSAIYAGISHENSSSIVYTTFRDRLQSMACFLRMAGLIFYNDICVKSTLNLQNHIVLKKEFSWSVEENVYARFTTTKFLTSLLSSCLSSIW